MDKGLDKKKALVMSSSRGLGLGIAEALADEGVNVLLTGRSEDKLKENEERLEKATNELKKTNKDLKFFKDVI